MCFNSATTEHKSMAPAMKMDYYRSISNISSGDESTDVESLDLDHLSLADSEDIASSTMDTGSALSSALATAQAQGRLTCGIYEAAKLLEMDPSGVMLCIVPVDTATDVAMHIHLTLIEAFCWESDIRLIKVDSSEMLQEAICGAIKESNTGTQTDVSVNDNDVTSGRVCPTPSLEDFSCILIEYPANGVDVTEAEEEVIMYHKHTCDLVPQPVLSLAPPSAQSHALAS